MNNYDFYEILTKAKEDNTFLIMAIEKVMPLINKYSLNDNGLIDEDLKSELIEYSINLIKDKNFVKKFKNF